MNIAQYGINPINIPNINAMINPYSNPAVVLSNAVNNNGNIQIGKNVTKSEIINAEPCGVANDVKTDVVVIVVVAVPPTPVPPCVTVVITVGNAIKPNIQNELVCPVPNVVIEVGLYPSVVSL